MGCRCGPIRLRQRRPFRHLFVERDPLSDRTAERTIPQKIGTEYWNRLYHQKKDGTFEDVTECAGLQGVGYGMGVAVGDYDNDGFEDLYVTTCGGNKLYQNRGDGTFAEVTETAGPSGSGWPTSAAWVDLDGDDGLLDLVVLRYLKWTLMVSGAAKTAKITAHCHHDLFPAVTPLVFHNDETGHFTEVSAKVGIDHPGKGLGIALADYDRDGRVDILVANDSMFEFLYHNEGNGTFEENGLLAATAVDSNDRTYALMGTDFGDYDGLPDLVVTDLANQKYALYKNSGDGSFAYVTDPSGVGAETMLHSGWRVRFIDDDNDELKDLIIVQGHDIDNIELSFPQLRYRESPMLPQNAGHGNFIDISQHAGEIFKQAWVDRGLAVGDLDNDGRQDVVVTTNDGSVYLLHNETTSANNWLTLDLVGHRSNRDAIGAEVKVVTSGGPRWLTISPAGSYLWSSDKRALSGWTWPERRWFKFIGQAEWTRCSRTSKHIVKIDEPVIAKPSSAN
jgi:hypothetical protein